LRNGYIQLVLNTRHEGVEKNEDHGENKDHEKDDRPRY